MQMDALYVGKVLHEFANVRRNSLIPTWLSDVWQLMQFYCNKDLGFFSSDAGLSVLSAH